MSYVRDGIAAALALTILVGVLWLILDAAGRRLDK